MTIDDKKAKRNVSVRLQPEVYNKISAFAAHDKRSISSEVAFILEWYIRNVVPVLDFKVTTTEPLVFRQFPFDNTSQSKNEE